MKILISTSAKEVDLNVGAKVNFKLKGKLLDTGVVSKVLNKGLPSGRGNIQEQKVFVLELKKLGTLKIEVDSSLPKPFPSTAGVLNINISDFEVAYKTKAGGK